MALSNKERVGRILEALRNMSGDQTRHCEEPKPRAKCGGQRRSTATPATSPATSTRGGTRSGVLAVAISSQSRDRR